MDIDFIEKCLTYNDGNTSKEKHIRFAGFEMCKDTKYNCFLFDSWWNSGDKNLMIGACLLKRSNTDTLPMKYAKEILLKHVETEYGQEILYKAYEPGSNLFNAFLPVQFAEYYSQKVIRLFVDTSPMSTTLLRDYLNSNDYAAWYYRLAGLYAAHLSRYRKEISYTSFFPFLHSEYKELRDAAARAMRHYELRAGLIEDYYRLSFNADERIAWMKVAKDRADVFLDLKPNQMTDEELREITGLSVHRDVAEDWENTDKENAAAIYWGLKHENWNQEDYINQVLDENSKASDILKEAAIVQNRDWCGSPYRTYEPLLVYQKCVGDVIVEAEIPNFAEVRGEPGKGRSRASCAIITDIIGDLFGQELAISLEDHHRVYHIGDTIDYHYDFTPGFRDIPSTGFHFYNTLDEAKNALY